MLKLLVDHVLLLTANARHLTASWEGLRQKLGGPQAEAGRASGGSWEGLMSEQEGI